MPEISVIIPCYNHAHYLHGAIASVLTQTFTSWEAIIVDDGSTDNTREVASRFSDPRIRYHYQENQGLSAARNAGIGLAAGGFLAFLDADDSWEPEFLGLCHDVLCGDESLAFVYSRNHFIDEDSHILPQIGGTPLAPERVRARLLEGGFFPCHSVLLRVSALEAVGQFDPELTSLEDWDLWLRISARYRARGIPEVLARYRIYPGSMSTNAARMHANRMAVLTKHFGPPDSARETWRGEKRRAYGFALRSAAYGHIAQGEADEGWRYLAEAAATYPAIMQRLDTYYELALGDQPRGYRGQADLLDLPASGADMLERLAALFTAAPPDVQAQREPAFGQANLALAMLSDQAGQWTEARHYLRQAVQAQPGLLRDRAVMRRLIKLSIGQRIVGRLKSKRLVR